MSHITLKIDSDMLRKARILARQKYESGGKVSQLIRDLISAAWIDYSQSITKEQTDENTTQQR